MVSTKDLGKRLSIDPRRREAAERQWSLGRRRAATRTASACSSRRTSVLALRGSRLWGDVQRWLKYGGCQKLSHFFLGVPMLGSSLGPFMGVARNSGPCLEVPFFKGSSLGPLSMETSRCAYTYIYPQAQIETQQRAYVVCGVYKYVYECILHIRVHTFIYICIYICMHTEVARDGFAARDPQADVGRISSLPDFPTYGSCPNQEPA